MTQTPHCVDIEIDPPFIAKVDRDRLRRIALRTLAQVNRTDAVQLTVLITDDSRIRELNRRFRSTDAPTDVLSFNAVAGEGQFVTAPEAAAYLGDVVVSYPRAAVQAEEAGHSILDELDLLVVHGVLHLLGWEDDTKGARAQMWSKQQEILSEHV